MSKIALQMVLMKLNAVSNMVVGPLRSQADRQVLMLYGLLGLDVATTGFDIFLAKGMADRSAKTCFSLPKS